jgi:hypothetical protein
VADRHQTRERSAWVLARAGRNPAARRRGERLASRARRSTRYEAGVGDAAVGEVVTPNRVHRAVYRGDDHRILRVLWLALRESVRALLAGPGIAASWGLYGLWWRNAASWGPMRWKPVAAVALGALPVLLVIVGAVIWMHDDVPFLAWYATAQLVVAVARLAWLVRAYGWEAVISGARPNRGHTVTRITGLPKPVPTRIIVRRRVAPPTPPRTIIVRTTDHEESDL